MCFPLAKSTDESDAVIAVWDKWLGAFSACMNIFLSSSHAAKGLGRSRLPAPHCIPRCWHSSWHSGRAQGGGGNLYWRSMQCLRDVSGYREREEELSFTEPPWSTMLSAGLTKPDWGQLQSVQGPVQNENEGCLHLVQNLLRLWDGDSRAFNQHGPF